jgi:hypothetical protein
MNRFKNFTSILAALLSALIVWEILLGALVEKTPGSTIHPVLGKITKAGTSVRGSEGFSITKTNSLGMRGEELTQKKTNEYRILILGDSFTEAFQVSDHKIYPYLLERKLGDRLIRNRNKSDNKYSEITAINAGRAGSSPATYIALGDFYKTLTKPDFVIVQVNELDFTEDLYDSNKIQHYLVKENTTYKLQSNEKFFSSDPLSQIVLQNFPNLRFLLELSVLRIGGKKVQGFLRERRNELDKTQFKTSKEKHQKYFEGINWVIENLKDTYPNLVVLYFPDIDYRNSQKTPSEVELSLEVESSLEKVTTQHNVHFVNMREDFINYYHVYHQPAHGFNNTVPGTGHTNEIGHELTAEHLASLFERRILK